MVHVGEVGYLLGRCGGAQHLHGLAVEVDAVNIHVPIGEGVHQRVVHDIVAVQVGSLYRGAVTDAHHVSCRIDEQRIVFLDLVKAYGRVVRYAVENPVGGAENVVSRVCHVIVTIMVNHHTALRPAAVHGYGGDGTAAPHLGGGDHVVDLHSPVSGCVKVPASVVVHKHGAVDGHAHIPRHDLKALGGGGTAEDVVSVARGGGVHVKVTVIVVDLGGVGSLGELFVGTEPLTFPVDQIRGGPAFHAHASVLGADVQVVHAVVAHNEGIAEAVARPCGLTLTGEEGVRIGRDLVHGDSFQICVGGEGEGRRLGGGFSGRRTSLRARRGGGGGGAGGQTAPQEKESRQQGGGSFHRCVCLSVGVLYRYCSTKPTKKQGCFGETVDKIHEMCYNDDSKYS